MATKIVPKLYRRRRTRTMGKTPKPTKRIISRVKLLVEWEQGGAKEHANAVTVDVSHSGCLAVVERMFPCTSVSG